MNKVSKIFASYSLTRGNMQGRTKQINCNRIVLVGQEFVNSSVNLLFIWF